MGSAFHLPDKTAVPPFGPGILQVDDSPDGGRQPADERDLQDEADDEVKYPTPEEEGHTREEYRQEKHCFRC